MDTLLPYFFHVLTYNDDEERPTASDVATIILPHSFDEENLTIGRQVGPAPRQRAAFALLSTTSPSLWTHFGPDLMWHERYDALPWRPNYTLAYSLTAELARTMARAQTEGPEALNAEHKLPFLAFV